MSYRDDVKITHETVHRIVLWRGGRTTVDVALKPDADRETVNGELSINGDYGSFHYYWTATGTKTFSAFLRGLRYDYAMTKLCGGPDGAYDEDWSTMDEKMKSEVLRLRREDELDAVQARALYDYFNGDYLLDHFGPTSYEEMRHDMEVSLYVDFGRKERRVFAEDYEGDDEIVPAQVMYGGEYEYVPHPDHVRAHEYFWDEVWPVIVDEIEKLEVRP